MKKHGVILLAYVTKVYSLTQTCTFARSVTNMSQKSFTDASFLCGKSFADVLETHTAGVLPTEIAVLVNQTLLFKFDSKGENDDKFDDSYKVRKVCTDVAIISEFKEKWDREDAILIKNINVRLLSMFWCLL